MIRVALMSVLSVAAVSVATEATAAETFRFEASDGTVYYTNAPTSPSFRRIVERTGTGAGWLRLPTPDSASAYVAHIRQAAARHGVPEWLVSAIIRAESDFNPRAVSSKGARGLMQLMPQTASILGVRDSFDPGENIEGGVRHLRGLLDRFGTLSLAVAAYNAGEQAVTFHRGIPPYLETQSYVAKVLRLFNGSADLPPAPALTVTYRVVNHDGTVVYTNIPPRGIR